MSDGGRYKGAAVIDETTIREAVERIARSAPGSRVIVFGSHARGEADDRSDLDLLVIEPEVENPLAEAVRLQAALAPLAIPVDLVVVSAAKFDYWKDTPNTLYHRAAREGQVHEPVP